MLTEELFKANETISFLSSLTGQNPELVKANLNQIGDTPKERQDSMKNAKGKGQLVNAESTPD